MTKRRTFVLWLIAMSGLGLLCAAEPEHGLMAEIWPDAIRDQWYTKPAAIRFVTPALDLHWEAGQGADTTMPIKDKKYWWTARFSGALVPPADGTYFLRLTADNFARLLLDNRMIINGWNTKGGTVLTSAPLPLRKGVPVAVLIEFVQDLGDAGITLEWQPPASNAFVVIPSTALRPHLPAGPHAVTRFRFFPTSTMKGGRLTGSNTSALSDFVELARIAEEPPAGQWSEIAVSNPRTFRFVKYESPPGSHGGVAEVEFYGGETKLAGTGFGTAGSRSANNTWRKALDGNTDTFFDAHDADDQYVGLDLGEAVQVAAPFFEPAPGAVTGSSAFVKITCSTPGAQIRYIIGTATPSEHVGRLYTEPLPITAANSIAAVAFKPGMAHSQVVTVTYRLDAQPLKPGLKTYHIGNSLTGNAIAFFRPIFESMGYLHTFKTLISAGAPTEMHWNTHRNRAIKDMQTGAPWDVLITQPFQGRNVSNESLYTGNFYEEMLKTSPQAKLYIYQQWCKPTESPNAPWELGYFRRSPWGPDKGQPDGPKATTWIGGIENHTRYYQILRDELLKRFPGKDIRIIPVGPAMVKLKQRIEAGTVTGINDFFSCVFADGIHVNPRGQYLAGLVHAAMFYEQSPAGCANIAGAGLTPEQMRIFQEVAWEAVLETLHINKKGE